MAVAELFEARRAYYNADSELERRAARHRIRAAQHRFAAWACRIRARVNDALESLREGVQRIAETLSPLLDNEKD